MIASTRRRALLAVIGSVLTVTLVLLGVWAVGRDNGPASSKPAGSGTPTATATPGGAPPSGSSVPVNPERTMTVQVYFHSGNSGGQLVAVTRTVPRTAMVAAAAVRQLLAGPTRAERAAGVWSVFSAESAGMLRAVRVIDGVAYLDFGDLFLAVRNVDGGARRAAFLGELGTTLRQFRSVHETVYALNGSIDAFYGWVQLPTPTTGAASAARRFATGILGMVQPTVESAVWHGGLVTARVRARAGRLQPYALSTAVVLRLRGMSWSVTGARTGVVNSQAPRPGQRISSPVHVAAALRPFIPGDAEVRVVQVVNGQPEVLGTGRLSGIPEMVFSGDIRYRTPSVATGWVLIVERSIETVEVYQKGEVLGGDAIAVTFVRSDRPQVLAVVTSPRLTERDGWWQLPAGAGSVSFNATVERAQVVQFYLVPTGTDTWAQRRLLPNDAYPGHPWGAYLAYPDAPLSARLVIVATGPGGQTTYDAHGIYHA